MPNLELAANEPQIVVNACDYNVVHSRKISKQRCDSRTDDLSQDLHIERFIRESFNQQICELSKVSHRASSSILKAARYITNLKTNSRVVISGVGKSGLIGRKIASTLASTGTPALFIHPTEAGHGDLGMISKSDIILLISQSGESNELNALIDFATNEDLPIIAITGNPKSKLSQLAKIRIDSHVDHEACPNGLAPTTSTTATLVIGDTLALLLSKLKGFQREDFARYHPSGSLGIKLLKVGQVLDSKGTIPTVQSDETVMNAILEISRGGIGIVLVKNNEGELSGVFTDGDLRRISLSHKNLNEISVREVMTCEFHFTDEHTLVEDAIDLMATKKIGALPVLKPAGEIAGVITLKQLITPCRRSANSLDA